MNLGPDDAKKMRALCREVEVINGVFCEVRPPSNTSFLPEHTQYARLSGHLLSQVQVNPIKRRPIIRVCCKRDASIATR